MSNLTISTEEIWRDIPHPDLSGKYQASSLGRVRSLDHYSFRKVVGKEVLIKGRVLKQNKTSDGYAQVTVSFLKAKRTTFRVSYLVFTTFHSTVVPKGFDIDHIDNDKTNNRADNLQLLKSRFNYIKRSMNLRKTSTFTGVSWSKQRNKWQSHIRINGKSTSLGRYDDEMEAAMAYQRALKSILK